MFSCAVRACEQLLHEVTKLLHEVTPADRHEGVCGVLGHVRSRWCPLKEAPSGQCECTLTEMSRENETFGALTPLGLHPTAPPIGRSQGRGPQVTLQSGRNPMSFLVSQRFHAQSFRCNMCILVRRRRL